MPDLHATSMRLFQEGWEREQAGDIAGANELYERALEGADIFNAAALRANLATNYAKLGDLDRAFAHFYTNRKTVLGLAPWQNRSRVLNQLAWFLYEHGAGEDYADALVLVDEALVSPPRDLELAFLDTKMRLLLRRGRDDEAREVAELAIGVDPDHPDFQDAAQRWHLGPYAALAAMRASKLFREIPAEGTAPPRSRGARAAFAGETRAVYVLGGEKPPHVTKTQGELRQRNAVHVLELVDGGARGRWRGPIAASEPEPEADGPTAILPRSQHVWTATGHGRFLLAHGGRLESGRGPLLEEQPALADCLALDVRNESWAIVDPPEEHESRLPAALEHAAALDSETGRVFLSIALASEGEAERVGLADAALPTVVLDTNGEPSAWARVTGPRGPGPSFRAGFSATVVGRELVVFGGYRRVGESIEHLDDACSLDLSTFGWSRCVVTGHGPRGRFDHAAFAVGSRALVILGGRRGLADPEWLPDAFLFDVPDRRFEKLTDALVVPPWTTWVALPGNPPRILAIATGLDAAPVFELDLAALGALPKS